MIVGVLVEFLLLVFVVVSSCEGVLEDSSVALILVFFDGSLNKILMPDGGF